MTSHPILSVVVPVFNEEENVDELYRRVTESLDGSEESFELVLVDDGSRDGSLSRMQALAARDSRVVVVRLSRNFGHQIAVSAGIDAARGQAIVLMDADLQDPPEVVPQMVALWRKGFDVVYGRRTRRPGESWFKRATAAAFYRLIRKMTSIDIPADVGDFRLMSRRVVEVLKQFQERNRFLRGMVTWIGFPQTAIHYERQVRAAGETKYPLRKMFRFAADAIFSFSYVPLRIVTGLGLLVSSLSFAYGVYTILGRLFHWDFVQGWASLMVAITFLGGVQLVSLGIIGEYLGRVYDEVKQRPLYVGEVERGRDAASRAPGALRSVGPIS
ncbi:MAG TPA: glycosyltransferase family 2 protein [Myxococcales bacterium]|nr:glycosyltransferase family 2 protein [Myxococcales bacterium]